MFHSMLTKRSVAANRRSARSAAFQVPSGQVGEIGQEGCREDLLVLSRLQTREILYVCYWSQEVVLYW
jgi:hypothetical protein